MLSAESASGQYPWKQLRQWPGFAKRKNIVNNNLTLRVASGNKKKVARATTAGGLPIRAIAAHQSGRTVLLSPAEA
jgi:hypothetical protein